MHRHASSCFMTSTVEMVEARPVRVRNGCGQQSCQAAAPASDLQPSIGRGRSRHRGAERSRFNSVPERLTPGHEGVFSHPLALPSRDGQRMANPAKLLADARKLLAEWRLTTQAKADNNSRGLVLGGLATVNGRRGRHL